MIVCPIVASGLKKQSATPAINGFLSLFKNEQNVTRKGEVMVSENQNSCGHVVS